MPKRLLTCLLPCLLALPGSRPGAAPGHRPAAGAEHWFVVNAGQWSADVRCALLGADTTSWVFADGFAQRFARWRPRSNSGGPRECEGVVVRTRFLGGGGEVQAEAPSAVPFRFLRGDRAHSATGSERVRIAALLPGVDLVARTDTHTGRPTFVYDLQLAAGAELQQIVACCEGVEDLAIDPDGCLVLSAQLPDGGRVELRQTPPVAWQETSSGRRPLAVAFQVLGPDRYGFTAPGRDPGLPLVVDPGLVWSTLLGGGSSDSVNDLQWHPNQGLWIGGWAGSTDFPVTTGAFRTIGGTDGFVAKLEEDGATLVWATYLGGSRGDEVRALAIDGGNAVTAVGWTRSTDFPVSAGALQATYAGASPLVDFGDAFVARLSSDGSTLLAGTYLGGIYDDAAEGVAVDGGGVATVAGWTSSPDFPTTPGVVQPALGGPVTLQPDGFVARVAADGRTLIWSTYLGGALPDQLQDLRLDAQGRATVIGYSISADYPTTVQAYRTTSAGGTEVVVTRLDAQAQAFVWSTFLGGQGTDLGLGLDVPADGSVWICGTTSSTNFPTTSGAFQHTLAGRADAFVANLSADGMSLPFASLLGGPGDDAARAVSTPAGGGPFITGETSGGMPVTPDATQASFGGGSLDAFVAEFAPSGASLVFATYMGGTGDESLLAAVRAGNGLAVVGGFTFAADFRTTTGALQTHLLGIEDGVVAQFDIDAVLDGSIRIAVPEPVAAAVFAPGDSVDALVLQLTNETQRELLPQSVRVFVGGAGDARTLAGISLWRDDPAQPGGRNQWLAGPTPVLADNGEVTLSIAALPPLPPGSSVLLRAALHSRPTAAAGDEFVVAVVGNEAWVVRAAGAGGGPQVAVTGSEYLAGAAQTAIAPIPFDGDADGDGRYTASDLRRLCQRLGQPAGAGVDPDGDGQITIADLLHLQDVILERPTVITCPTVVDRGQWVSMQGWFPLAMPSLTLGGRVLAVGSHTSRDVAFLIAADQPLGNHELQAWFPGRDPLIRRLDVR